jgi:putative addiction module antidote
MLTQKIRRVGNSLVVTIPKEEAERQGLHEGDLVGIEVRKMELRPALSPEVQAAVDWALKTYKADLDYLAER